MSVLPEEKNNIVMVPVRDLAAAFGLKVGWDEASGAVTVGDNITVALGANEMQANGKTVSLDQPAYEKNGTTFVPLISVLEGGLRKSCTSSKYGLVMVNDKPQELADSKAKAVNGYLLYDRPSQEKVLADLQAFSANDKHPRVMATKEDFDRIRSQRETSETMGTWVKTIVARADATLTQGTAQYIILDNKRLLNQCRVALNNMMYLGFAYQMTGDQKYADRAWTEVQAVGSFPNWNPTHFLDVGEMTAAVGIAYDWIYDAWTQEQKDYIVKIIKDFGLAPAAMEYSNGSYGFSKLTHNWNAVCSGGVGIGALAIAEADPEYCTWIVSSGIRGLEYLLDEFAPDGGYVEGPSYWEYAMQYMTMFFSSLYASLGTDYNLTYANGLSKTANYILSMDSSVGSIGFHDGGPGHSNAAYLFWLGDHYNTPGVISARLLKSKQLNTSVTVYDPLFYKDPSITASNIDLPLDSYFRGVEAVSMRSSWTSGQEAFLAFHAGQLNVNHYHVDSGQFVYYNLGEMWATDFGTDNVTYTDGYGIRDKIYRIRAEGHNVMVINPNTSPGMVLNSFSPVEKFVSKERGSYSIVDLSGAYAENANSARRGFMMADDRRSITVRDEVSLRAPSEVYWFMHTMANVELTENGAILTKNGKQMKLECATNAAEYELLVMDAEPLPTSPSYPGQANNSAYKKFAIKMKASGDLNVEVRLVPADDAYADRGLLGKPLSEWDIPDGELLIPPSANMLSVDGEPLTGFAPETTSYTIEVPVGRDKMPAVTIDAGAYTVETNQQPDKVVFKIYDAAAPDNFRYYSVNYKIVDPLDTMLGYDRYDATVTASEIPQPENADINVLDNDLTTRWSAQNTQWLLLDLGEVKQIDAICLAFYMGSERQYQYTLEVSKDGTTYQKVANGPSIASDGYVITRLDGIAARYVRYNANGGSNVNAWNSILEFGALVKK